MHVMCRFVLCLINTSKLCTVHELLVYSASDLFSKSRDLRFFFFNFQTSLAKAGIFVFFLSLIFRSMNLNCFNYTDA